MYGGALVCPGFSEYLVDQGLSADSHDLQSSFWEILLKGLSIFSTPYSRLNSCSPHGQWNAMVCSGFCLFM